MACRTFSERRAQDEAISWISFASESGSAYA